MLRSLGATLVLLAASTLPAIGQAADPVRGDIAFVDVNVVPMDRPGLLPAYTVVIRGNRVVPVGSVCVAGRRA